MDIRERLGGRKCFYFGSFYSRVLEDLVANQGLFVIDATHITQNVEVFQRPEMFLSKHLISRCNTYPGNNKIITIGGMNSGVECQLLINSRAFCRKPGVNMSPCGVHFFSHFDAMFHQVVPWLENQDNFEFSHSSFQKSQALKISYASSCPLYFHKPESIILFPNAFVCNFFSGS